MEFTKVEKFAFITMGVTVANTALMAMGVETMPHMWTKEVYENPLLGASIGGMTGIGIGGAVGAAYIAGSETLKAGVSALRDKFTPETHKKLTM